MEYVDLSIQTGKKQNKMRFLITDVKALQGLGMLGVSVVL